MFELNNYFSLYKNRLKCPLKHLCKTEILTDTAGWSKQPKTVLVNDFLLISKSTINLLHQPESIFSAHNIVWSIMVYNTIVHRYGNKSVQKYLGISITVS